MSNSLKGTDIKHIGSLESNILRTVTSLSDKYLAEENKLLSIWGMTVLQYNALHVIYENDIHEIGLSSREIGEGLNARVPDITRLLDRLMDKGWVIRNRDVENRRVVRTSLTQIGKELVTSASQPLRELYTNLLSHMSEQERKDLDRLLVVALKPDYE